MLISFPNFVYLQDSMTLALDIHLVALMLVLPLWAVWELPSILNNVHLTTAVEKLYFGKLFVLQVIYLI